MNDDVQLPWQRRGSLLGGERKEAARPFRPAMPSVKPVPTARPVSPTHPTRPSQPAPSSSTLSVGKHIIHNRFGRGEVLRIEGTGDSTKATVQFENVGTKQLLLKFAKFEVID